MKYALVLPNKRSTVHIMQANKVVQLVETLTLNACVCMRVDLFTSGTKVCDSDIRLTAHRYSWAASDFSVG